MEKNGVDYQFISKLEFKDLINQSFFAEWEKVHGFYYGTSKKVIDKIIHNNEMLLMEMDVQGALSIKELYPNKTFSIFVCHMMQTFHYLISSFNWKLGIIISICI